MIPSARIHRGFHRVGVVLALPFMALSLLVACQQTWIGWDSFGAKHAVIPRADGSITYDEAFPHPHAFYGYAIAWAALALVLYTAARAVGWVFAGFTGSDRSAS